MIQNGHVGKVGLEGLAMLATGEADAIEYVKEQLWNHEVPHTGANANWYNAYGLIILCEYYLLTGDEEVLPAIRSNAEQLHRYRDGGGMWGHGVSGIEAANYPEGPMRQGGYGSIHATTYACHLAMLLAERCGVQDSHIVEKSRKVTEYIKSFVGEDLRYAISGYSDDGSDSKNGVAAMAAIAMALEGEIEVAKYFAGICLAAGDEIDDGHTGPYFGHFWTGLGAGLTGVKGSSEYFKKVIWRRSGQRRWDGGYRYDDRTGFGYSGLSEVAPHLVNLVRDRKRLVITGKGLGAIQFSDAEVSRAVVGFDESVPKDFSWVWEHRNSYSPDVRKHALLEGRRHLSNPTFYQWIKSSLEEGPLMDRLAAYQFIRLSRGSFSSDQVRELKDQLFKVSRSVNQELRYRAWAAETLYAPPFYPLLTGTEFEEITRLMIDDSVFVNWFENEPIMNALMKVPDVVSAEFGPFGGNERLYDDVVRSFLSSPHNWFRSSGHELVMDLTEGDELLKFSAGIREILLDQRRDYYAYPGSHGASDWVKGRFEQLLVDRGIDLDELIEGPSFGVVNWAFYPGVVATQSSTGFGGVPGRAIDGNRDGRWENNSVTHTEDSSPGWWQVDLGQDRLIDRVVLSNRIDGGLQRRLSNFRMSVFSAIGALVMKQEFYVESGHAGDTEVWKTGGVLGRVVRIELLGSNRDGNGVLSLAEVEVMGSGVPINAGGSPLSSSVDGLADNELSLSYPDLLGGSEVYEWSVDLLNWRRLVSGPTGLGFSFTQQREVIGGQVVTRVVMEPLPEQVFFRVVD